MDLITRMGAALNLGTSLLLGLAALAVIGALVWLGIRQLRKLRIKACARRIAAGEASLGLPVYARGRSGRWYEGYLVRLSRRLATNLPARAGLDELWLASLEKRPNARSFRLLLEFFPDSSGFAAFQAMLQRPGLRKPFMDWFTGQPRFQPFRYLAMNSRGRDFDGAAAASLFSDRLGEIRELSGDPEWPVRYFALRIILHDPSPAGLRCIKAAFDDSHALIRKSILVHANSLAREELYTRLSIAYLDDPVPEVRRAARERLGRDFADLFSTDYASLSTSQAMHILELLDTEREEDLSLAMRYLDGKNLELRLAAAVFLEKAGSLVSLYQRADPADPKDFEHIETMLAKACEVNICGFLQADPKPDQRGSLLIASRLLRRVGDPEFIRPLWMAISQSISAASLSKADLDLYQAGLEAIADRGDDASLQLLDKELQLRYHEEPRSETRLLAMILTKLPARAASRLHPRLLNLLIDPDFPLREELCTALQAFPADILLAPLISIIRAGRDQHPHRVRIDALRLLGRLKLPYCIQMVLEYLPTLPLEEIQDFTKLLAETDIDALEARIAELLKHNDAQVRAALLAGVSATGRKTFLKEVKAGLEDADPEVRIAAVQALIDFDESRTLNQAVELLRDPIERVRLAVAAMLGRHGSESVLKKLEAILLDANETFAVKQAAIDGLAASDENLSLNILVDQLQAQTELQPTILQALAGKTSQRFVKQLIVLFKDGQGELRNQLGRVFEAMGEAGESALVDLLYEDIASLKTYISDIMDKTGLVESRIRDLAHRLPDTRRSAADFLSRVGSLPAFRGLVLAARDPDQRVRILVTKALERLNTADGQEMLEQLQQDPDRKIRAYTRWAMERLKAKSLD